MIDGTPSGVLDLSEWHAATERVGGFEVTNTLKQQNPFTNEYVFFDSPGSGYWVPAGSECPTWSNDDRVWFRFAEQGVTFIQFEDPKDPELLALAELLNAGTTIHIIGSGS